MTIQFVERTPGSPLRPRPADGQALIGQVAAPVIQAEKLRERIISVVESVCAHDRLVELLVKNPERIMTRISKRVVDSCQRHPSLGLLLPILQ